MTVFLYFLFSSHGSIEAILKTFPFQYHERKRLCLKRLPFALVGGLHVCDPTFRSRISSPNAVFCRFGGIRAICAGNDPRKVKNLTKVLFLNLNFQFESWLFYFQLSRFHVVYFSCGCFQYPRELSTPCFPHISA